MFNEVRVDFVELPDELSAWTRRIDEYKGRFPRVMVSLRYHFDAPIENLLLWLESSGQAALAGRLEQDYQEAIEMAANLDKKFASPASTDADRQDLDIWQQEFLGAVEGLANLIRKTVDLTQSNAFSMPAANAATLARTAPVPPHDAARSRVPKQLPPSGQPLVVLRGQGECPIVLGEEVPPLTEPQYRLIEALIRAGNPGLTMKDLNARTGQSDARKTLARLVASDARWQSVIQMAGTGYRGYRIRYNGEKRPTSVQSGAVQK